MARQLLGTAPSNLNDAVTKNYADSLFGSNVWAPQTVTDLNNAPDGTVFLDSGAAPAHSPANGDLDAMVVTITKFIDFGGDPHTEWRIQTALAGAFDGSTAGGYFREKFQGTWTDWSSFAGGSGGLDQAAVDARVKYWSEAKPGGGADLNALDSRGLKFFTILFGSGYPPINAPVALANTDGMVLQWNTKDYGSTGTTGADPDWYYQLYYTIPTTAGQPSQMYVREYYDGVWYPWAKVGLDSSDVADYVRNIRVINGFSGDLNVVTEGVLFVNASGSTNEPGVGNGLLETWDQQGAPLRFQRYSASDQSIVRLRFRWSGNWSAWTDPADARINALTPALAKTAVFTMPAPVTDLNAAPDGFSIAQSGAANMPSGIGSSSVIVESIRYTGFASPYVYQTATREDNGQVYGRYLYGTTWQSWQTVTKASVGLGNVDNTADTAKPVSTAQQTALDLKAPLASPAFTGTPTGITKTHVGLGNVDNTADTAKPVSTAQQNALNLKAPLASPAFTGTPTGITQAHVGLGNVDNTADTAKPVSTAQQNALNLKAPLASPAFTGTPTGITKTHVGLSNVDNTADTAKPVSTAQQTALDLKAPLASPAFTGTPTGITKTHVGLGNVDNTADTAKPVSTAQQTALDLKAPLASPALSGTPTAPTPVSTDSSTQIATTAFVKAVTPKITVGTTAPSNPSINDLWVDTN